MNTVKCAGRFALLTWIACAGYAAFAQAAPPSAPGTAGGITDPLNILQIRFGFGAIGGDTAHVTVLPGIPIPAFSITLQYRGSGVLRGRWEVAIPGETPPGTEYSMPEYALTDTDRSRMQRYRVVDSFQEVLGPVGRHVISGPDPAKLPRELPGRYVVLFRIASISAVTANNPQQTDLRLPRIEYTVLGIAPAGTAP